MAAHIKRNQVPTSNGITSPHGPEYAAYALLYHLHELLPHDRIEVGLYIQLQNPARGPGTSPPSHFVQCLLLPSSGSEPVRAIEKILLIDGVQQANHDFLQDLILQG